MEALTITSNHADCSKSGHRSKSDMRVLFIGLPNSASRPGKAGLFLPLGLSYLSAVLKNHGYKYDCIDIHTEEILHPSHSGDLWDHLSHFDFSSYAIGQEPEDLFILDGEFSVREVENNKLLSKL